MFSNSFEDAEVQQEHAGVDVFAHKAARLVSVVDDFVRGSVDAGTAVVNGLLLGQLLSKQVVGLSDSSLNRTSCSR